MNIRDISITDEKLRVMLETGYILREASEFDKAETIFRGVMELLPDSEVPEVGLGTVFLQKGDFTSALAICANAIRKNPGSLYARVHHAEALLFSKNREQAENELNEIIQNNPDSPHSQTAKALLEAVNLIC